MCLEHLVLHQMTNSSHKYISVSLNSCKESNECLLRTLVNYYGYCGILRKKVTSEARLLIEKIGNATDLALLQLQTMEKTILSHINLLSIKRQPESSIEDSLHSLTFLPLSALEKKIQDDFKYPLIVSTTRNLLVQIHELFKFEYIKYPFQLDTDKNLYYFQEGTSNLVAFDVERQSAQTVKINQNFQKGHAATVCYVSKGKVFYGGGFYNNQTLKRYFLIDTEKFSVTALPDGRGRKQAGSCVRFPYIFIFGGSEGDRAMKFCDKFNLETLKWEVFAELPYESDTCVIDFAGKILVTGGLLTGVYVFDCDNNVYIEVLGNLPKAHKFLCCANGKAYLLCNGLLYWSELWNPWKWSILKEIPKLGKYWISYSIRYKENIYFTTGHYAFFNNTWAKARAFNLNTHEIIEII